MAPAFTSFDAAFLALIEKSKGAAPVPTVFTMWAWGGNDFYELGSGNTTYYSSPVQVGAALSWKKVALAAGVTYGIKSDNSLWTWGTDNWNGGLLLRGATGDVATSPVQVGSLTDWALVAASFYNAHQIKTDGTLWGAGSQSSAEIGDGTNTPRSSPVQIGTSTIWKIVASSYTLGKFAIRTDGTLWVWGTDQSVVGLLGLGSRGDSKTSPVQIGSLTDWNDVISPHGLNMMGCIKSDNTLWTWGLNDTGQLGLGDRNNRSSPTQVGSLTDWKQAACTMKSTLAVKADGTLWAWGSNDNGQLGLGDTNGRSSPTQVGSLTNWKQVTCTQYSALAVKTDGTLWSWGNNDNGQLGLGDNTTKRSSPTQVGSNTNWHAVISTCTNVQAPVFALSA